MRITAAGAQKVASQNFDFSNDSEGVYAAMKRKPDYFTTPDGKRMLCPATHLGKVAGLKPAGAPGTCRYVDALGTKWLVQEWLVATPMGEPQRYSWTLDQAEPDWSRAMPQRWQYVKQHTPPGEAKRYLADGKRYIVREYPLESGGVYQVAVRTDAKWQPV